MAPISSGARAAAFDWNDLDRKRKLLALSFSYLSHIIGLSLK